MRKFFTIANGIVIILGLIASFVTYLQTTRVTPLIDYSYQVENAYRIYQGAVPFRDFFLVVAPGTYWIMAQIMHLTHGYLHIANVYYVMFVSFFTIWLTYRICILLGVSEGISVILLLPLIFTGQSVYPYPLYDPNVALVILLALYAFFVTQKKYHFSQIHYTLAGAVSALPVFFKQNTGGAYIASFLCIFLFTVIVNKKKQNIHAYIAFTFGVVFVLASIFLWLLYYGAWDQYIYQTFTFPSVAKNPGDAMHIILSQYVGYGVLLWNNIFVVLGLMCVVSLIAKIHHARYRNVLLGTLTSAVCIYLLVYVPALKLHDTFVLCAWVTITLGSVICMFIAFWKRTPTSDVVYITLPIILLASAHATFLSHGVVHSSYHMWPFAVILLGYIAIFIKKHTTKFLSWWIIVQIFIIFLTILLGQAIISNYAMDYVDRTGNISVVTDGKLKGLHTPGMWISEFEAMMIYVKNTIPTNARVAFLPGEDPFFSVSERTNPLHFSLLHSGVYTLAASVIIPELLNNHVDWIVVKTTYQTRPGAWVTNMDEISYWIEKYYTLSTRIGIYAIYQRK